MEAYLQIGSGSGSVVAVVETVVGIGGDRLVGLGHTVASLHHLDIVRVVVVGMAAAEHTVVVGIAAAEQTAAAAVGTVAVDRTVVEHTAGSD